MEKDFAGFVLMSLIWCFPFGFIYLTLHLLNWNERKNLFSDSWFVYLTWIVSSLIGYVVCVLVGQIKFRYQSEFVAFVSIILSMALTNICAIAGVLYIRSRGKKASNIENYLDEDNQKQDTKKIWRTSAIVSIGTLVFVVSLIMAVVDLGGKWEKQRSPKESFGVYDL